VPARLSSTPEFFRDRLVIAGATYAGSGDQHRVPRFASEKLLSGQFVQALIANTILSGNPVHEFPQVWSWAVVGLVCFLTMTCALCFPQHFSLYLVAMFVLFLAYAGLAFWVFRTGRTMIAMLGPEFAILFSMLAAGGLKAVLSAYPLAEP
jgi:CHASE2 domain-containing sensor protein